MRRTTSDRSTRDALGRAAFTLIELLVVIAIIALLVGILLPALGAARESAKRTKCLANTRQMSVAMNLYANVFKNWYPVQPVRPGDDPFAAQNQRLHGGVAGLFSLEQNGDGTDMGYGGGTPGGLPYINGDRVPLMEPYFDGPGALVCPSDKTDRLYTSSSSSYGLGRVKEVRPANSIQELASYRISYMYISGFKTDEQVLVKPAPLWGDETNGLDIGTNSWYGNAADAAAAGTKSGFYGPDDNHKKDGANFAYTDGHAEFSKGNVAALFFQRVLPNGQINPNSISAIQPNRDQKIQTID
jgi:prepilin-type N-terminal cleavage/methylation domain-containing protein/prepilin-type processing-associated H-X9-DG protein